VIYARNACWALAEQVGCRYFVQLDDDYSAFFYRNDSEQNYCSLRVRLTMNDLFSAFVDFYEATPILTVALSQGGDFLGGIQADIRLRRKAMNSFICSVDRPFTFVGRMNDDVNTYISLGRRGGLFFNVLTAQLVQATTQANSGGLTELYLEMGTYVKSFYTVMYAPSCVTIGEIFDSRSPHPRIHHRINWHKTAPLILREKHRKTPADEERS